MTVIHFDMDAFYASIEIRDNPQYKNKPLVVGGGVVTTANYEARKFGVHSAMNTMMARKLCPHLIVVPVDSEKYHNVSNYIHSLIEKITKVVEYVALDEGYMDVTDIITNYPSKEYFAMKFKERIFKKTGLTCSVGVGYNKLSAKIASDINKPNGYYIFNNPNEFVEYIKDKDIKIIPGVGKKLQELLKSQNIIKAGDVYKYSLYELVKRYGTSRGYMLYYYTRGINDNPIDTNRDHISIGNENTYKYPLMTQQDLIREYTQIFERAYSRMKKKGYLCKSVNIKIKYSDFSMITRSKNIDLSDDKILLFEKVQDLMEEITQENIRLVGVSFNNLVPKDKIKRQLPIKFSEEFL